MVYQMEKTGDFFYVIVIKYLSCTFSGRTQEQEHTASENNEKGEFGNRKWSRVKDVAREVDEDAGEFCSHIYSCNIIKSLRGIHFLPRNFECDGLV